MHLETLEPRMLLSDSAPLGNGTLSAGTDAEHGTEVWFSDANGSHIVADLNEGAGSSDPHAFQNIGGSVYYIAARSDGIEALFFTTSAIPGNTWTALSAQQISSGSGLDVNGLHVLAGYGGTVWTSTGTADSLTFIGSAQRTYPILYRDRVWFISMLGGAASSTDGFSIRTENPPLEKIVGAAYGWTFAAPTIMHGWLTTTATLKERHGIGYTTTTHTWYTDGVHGFVQGNVPEGVPGMPIAVGGGVFSLTGTSENDVIRFTTKDGSLNVFFNGIRQSFDVNQITSIHIDGGDGADTIDLTNVAIASHISGGNGSDRITGSAANDVIYGGSGNDTIDGGLGTDHIFGGTGRDVFVNSKRLELFDFSRLDQLLHEPRP